MNPFATHIRLLYECCRRTTGPILELGMGPFSTPVVHAFAYGGRYVRSYESDRIWFDGVAGFLKIHPVNDSDSHDFSYVETWDDAVIQDRMWDVALLDHGPAKRRQVEIMKLKGRCRFLVCHDAYGGDDYDYPKVFPLFANVVRDGTAPHTAVVSDEPLDFLVEFLQEDILPWPLR